MENQRVRISKQMLKDALIGLLEEKDLRKITVYEICSRAEINRTTFYKYYDSPQDLLSAVEADLLGELEQRLMSCELSDEGLSRTLSFLDQERKKCLILINATTDMYFAEKLFALPQIEVLMKKHMPSVYTEEQARYMKTFIYHGGYAIVRQWLNLENREPPEEISKLFLMMISSISGAGASSMDTLNVNT